MTIKVAIACSRTVAAHAPTSTAITRRLIRVEATARSASTRLVITPANAGMSVMYEVASREKPGNDARVTVPRSAGCRPTRRHRKR
jgi:hypothetical protein